MTIIFGLTGGIACGKSTVASIFTKDGIPMVDADLVARSVAIPGSKVMKQLVKLFSPDILHADGSLNRRALGMMVFNDPKQMAQLNEIMYTPIKTAINAALKATAKTTRLMGYDCALIIETGQQYKYRPLVVVATTPKVQLRRLMARNSLTDSEAKARIESQMSTTDKLKYADFVIWNNGDEGELIDRTMEVCCELKQLS
jgi:dephospho-CoA kinase